ncbi:glutamate decarboxylase [Metschnikowia bicuspidata]|uniref:glutamate decarboxylase n=1 Tax=Metschnikowia bicuspidata TaxID=27322 RepID=A0A4P9ZCN1_9ASCO|nr:glutamate decarboxylase [Metschnikowia bicuspidata]
MILSSHIDAAQLQGKLFAKTIKTKLSKNEEYIIEYNSNREAPNIGSDGLPTLNFASFVNTNSKPHAEKLINSNIVKNLADNDEYPSLIECQQRCINIFANLWNAPVSEDTSAIGTATTGSSKAIMLAGLAMKKTWQEKRNKTGKSNENPNILMASVAQVALEKFAQIKKNIDENTIGILFIMGSTFTGAPEPVEQISNLLDEVQKETGFDIPIHVDGASGGFVAPFFYPHLKWDFSVPRVVSINTSGHKFGLTTAGLGWVIWREAKYLPESLRFTLDYLGGVEETFGLNFSRPGFPVLHKYYNFLTFGKEGYTKKFVSCLSNARFLSQFLETAEYYEVLSSERTKLYTRNHDPNVSHKKKNLDSENYMPGLPVVAFRFSKKFRNRQYVVPKYHLTSDEQEKKILRVVVKDNLSLALSHDAVLTALDARKGATELERRDIVYKLLRNIASNGVKDVKEEQRKTMDKPRNGYHKHKKSYRGACLIY